MVLQHSCYNHYMKTLDQLKLQFLNTSADPVALVNLLNDAIQLIEFEQASKCFIQKRLTTATEQIVRQTTMIENLEKTLWSKRAK